MEKKFYGAADIINLLDLRTKRGRFEMLLIGIRRQINEINGVSMPLGGWVTDDL